MLSAADQLKLELALTEWLLNRIWHATTNDEKWRAADAILVLLMGQPNASQAP